MKRNIYKVIVSVILVHILTACTPTDFMGSGSSTFNFESSENVNQQQGGQAEIVSVSFDDQFVTVKEGEDAEVKIKLNKVSSSDIYVQLTSPNGEAKLGSDFIIESSTISIPKGSLTASFKIKALADGVTEQSETFFGQLQVFQKDLAIAGTSSLSVIIQDSTVTPPPSSANPVVSYISATGVASEAQSTYQVPVVLSTMATKDVIINVSVDAGSSATLGTDFLIQSGNMLVIPAGSQSAMLQISIIDDNVVESTPETISVSLSSAVNATIGSLKQFQLTIIDNDSVAPAAKPIVSLATAAASVSEATPTYNLLVTLDKPATQEAIIQYAVQGVTATEGSDFTVDRMLKIPAGQQTGIIAISIINDVLAENTEILNVILSSAVFADIGANKSFALSIVDNDAPQNNVDPLVSLASASGAASEGQGSYAITFNLNKVATENVTIMLTLSGTALQNQDFSLPMGDNIVIPAGALSAALPIIIIDDALDEPTENAIFTIGSVSGGGAKLGAITSFNFGIMDNDNAAPAVDKNLLAYTETLYNNIQRNPNTGRCFNCHRPTSNTPRSPFHAHDDAAIALQTIQGANLVNLDNPAASRLVTKVEGGHYPWSGSSIEDAALIASYIQMWADRVKAGAGTPPVASNKIETNGLLISEGKEVEGTVRYANNQIALWDFKKGADEKVIYDVSGVSPAVNLAMAGDIEWIGGQGVSCNQNAVNGVAQATPAASKKLFDRFTSSNQFTIEAWATSSTKDQNGPTRIMSYSSGTANRNFTMGQQGVYYQFRNRNPETDNNGVGGTYEPQVAQVGDRPVTQHIVMVYDGSRRRLYVNGAAIAGDDPDAAPNTPLSNWNDGYNFLFCNETTAANDPRGFKGSIHFAAAHDRALTPAQIKQNYDAGFTKKLALEFDIAQHTNPGAKLNVQVEVQGNYVITSDLKFSGLSSPVDVSGIRFAVNGKDAAGAQSYTYLEKENVANSQTFTEVASLLNVEDLATAKLSANFQQLGSKVMPVTPLILPYEGMNTNAANPEPTDPSSIRLFSELYQTMSNITGVPASNEKTVGVYNEIKSGLPTDSGLNTFTSSHQINIIKLAYEYCNEMIADAALRNAFFGNINVSQSINAASKAQIAQAVLNKAIGRSIATQASNAEVTTQVTSLVDEMAGFNKNTSDILKGACVLSIGSMNNLVK